MKITFQIDGLIELRKAFEGFSERRMRSVAATAATVAVRDIERGWRDQLVERFDRPTKATREATFVATANPQTMEATVGIKDMAGARGRAPAEWLSTEEEGGSRYVKRFEMALQNKGAMLRGWSAVPSKFAKLDSFGNVSRGQIVQVIAQLGAQFSPGYQQVISRSATKRAQKALLSGNQFVAFPRKTRNGLEAGVYQRRGDKLVPIFFFVPRVRYGKRISLIDFAKEQAPKLLGANVERAFSESLGRLWARGKAL